MPASKEIQGDSLYEQEKQKIRDKKKAKKELSKEKKEDDLV